jgi:hypothetical protein
MIKYFKVKESLINFLKRNPCKKKKKKLKWETTKNSLNIVAIYIDSSFNYTM